MPHGHCFLWQPDILWLHITSDAAIVLAYFSIPLVLIYFVTKRQDIPFVTVFWLFGAFILLCGTTHLMGIWVLWHPNYALEGIIKAMTGIASLLTLIVIIRLLPKMMLLPSPKQLALLNIELEHNINERDKAQKDLQYAYDVMEKRVEERTADLSKLLEKLTRSNRELDDFAYIASHDLKEPLRGIYNHSRFLLEDNKEKLDEESVNRISRLIYLSQRMEKLVNDLLYFSRLGRQDLAIQPTDLNLVVDDIKETLEHFLHEREANIIIPKQLPMIICDKPRISEVFRNLITNAVKYNDKPDKIVEIGSLDNHVLPDGKKVSNVFFVKDNGPGIAPEFYDEVFRIFRRLRHTFKDKTEEGTGVGLTFVKKIIERHGGKIWLESELDKGTIFYFTLGEISDGKHAPA